MKRKKIYTLVTVAFLIMVALIFFRHQAREKNKEEKVYYLLERKGSAAKTKEWEQVSDQAKTLLQKIQDNRNDIKSMIALATLYIREARITGNNLYYDRAAMKYANDVLKRDENHFEGLSLKAIIFLSQHHFAEALDIAKKATAINPYNAFVYGTLVDGYVEMGDYNAAVENLEKMMSIRPDMRSYARVSYLREIHGDYAGAIEAMKLAVAAGAPGDEAAAWTRVQLGQLYEKTSEMKLAELHYLTTLEDRPQYPYALAGLARIAVHQKKYKDAIKLFQQADSLITDYSMKEALIEVYELNGENRTAKSLAGTIVKEMDNASKKDRDSAGHYSDRELAYAYLKVDDNDKALEHALAEYNRRPENIDVNETIAWVYYWRGEYAKALPHVKTAMRTNSLNPTLLCRAGLIFAKTGDASAAKALLPKVLAGNTNIPESLKSEGQKVLATL